MACMRDTRPGGISQPVGRTPCIVHSVLPETVIKEAFTWRMSAALCQGGTCLQTSLLCTVLCTRRAHSFAAAVNTDHQYQ